MLIAVNSINIDLMVMHFGIITRSTEKITGKITLINSSQSFGARKFEELIEFSVEEKLSPHAATTARFSLNFCYCVLKGNSGLKKV